MILNFHNKKNLNSSFLLYIIHALVFVVITVFFIHTITLVKKSQITPYNIPSKVVLDHKQYNVINVFSSSNYVDEGLSRFILVMSDVKTHNLAKAIVSIKSDSDKHVYVRLEAITIDTNIHLYNDKFISIDKLSEPLKN